ncbi:MAG: DUF362 domain-containing protein [Acidobacteria bacterium]|nr:DUF362 domain-containing protein [Acidobacteriota bacterium]
MLNKLSRRSFIATAAGATIAERMLRVPGIAAHTRADALSGDRSVVSLVQGEERRKNIRDSLVAIEDQILPVLRTKKYVVIKPNLVSTVNQLAATHADALRGILEFLGPRFKGPVVIAESSAGDTLEGYRNFDYPSVVSEFKSQRVSLIDLNDEAKYEIIPLLDGDLHAVPCRLAARLLDPEAYIICAGVVKTHNVTVATLSVKNMTLGAPLHNPRTEKRRWNDKRIYHGGVRQTHFDILLTAQEMRPYWGAAVIDGFEGMEGNGPASGTPVPSRIAIASTDLIAADRVGVEAMGINPDWLAYLRWCEMAGLGRYDIARIDIRGAKLAAVRRQYQLHRDIERELQWMGPLTEIPPKLG